MNSLWIAWNMVRRALGNMKSILTYLVIPVAVVSVIIILIGGKSVPDPIGYVNLDEGPAGARLMSELARKEGRELQAEPDEAAAKRAVTDRKLQFAIIVPADYSRSLLEDGDSGPIYYRLNLTEDSVILKMALESEHARLAASAGWIRAGIAANPGNGADARNRADERFAALLKSQETQTVKALLTDENLYPREGLNNVIGFTLLFLMNLAGTCVSLILDDRREGTMARIFTTPVRSAQIAVGNFLGCFVLGGLQITLLLLVTRGLMRYDYGVPIWLHAAILVAFMLVTIGLATALAGVVRNPESAPTLNTLIITPTCMLGGCFWPVAIMPDYLQTAANFMPQKWAIEAVQRVADGGGLTEVTMPLLILLLMAFVLLAIGSVILKPGERSVIG